MTISPGQSAEVSPGISSQTFDTLKLLLSIRDILNTLQLDSVSNNFDIDSMQVHTGKNKEAKVVPPKFGFPQDIQSP